MTNRSVRFAVCSALGLALAGLAGSGVAFAQDPPPADPTAPPPAGETAPPPATGDATAVPAAGGAGPAVTLRQAGVSVDGDVVIGLSSGSTGEPIQITPNLYYGISDQLTIGIAHNPFAEIFQTFGGGLCLSGEPTCSNVYNNVSADVLFSFSRSSTMDIAFHGGLDVTQISDPTLLSLRVGVKGKMLAGPLVLVFDPALNVGVTDRDAFNSEFLSVPIRVGFMATPQLNLGLSTGLFGLLTPPIGGFGDVYFIPVGVGGTFALSNQLALRAQFTFDNLAGNGGGADFRTLSVGAVFNM